MGQLFVGDSYNKTLTNKILNIAQSINHDNLNKARSAQYIEGRARVANGETQQSIKEEQGFLDGIFGQATLQGAAAQEVIQAGDQHQLYMQENMNEFRKVPTEQFIADQTQYVKQNLLTGDPEVDNLITITASNSISASARLHAKEHALYKQTQGKLTFENNVTSAAKILDNSLNPDDKIKAQEKLVSRLKIAPGQTEGAWKSSIGALILSELSQDREDVYNLTSDVQLDAITRAKIEEAYEEYTKRTDISNQLNQSKTRAELIRQSRDPGVTVTELLDNIIEARKGGWNATTDQLTSLISTKSQINKQVQKARNNVIAVEHGAAFTTKSDQANALDDYEAALETQVNKAPTKELKAQAATQAKYAIVHKNLEYSQLGNATSTRLNTNLNHMMEEVGNTKKVSENFINSYKEILDAENIAGREASVLYQSKLDPEALGNFNSVKSMIEFNPGIKIEEAIRRSADSKLSYADAAKVVDNDPKIQKLLTDLVEDPDSMPWYKEMFFGKFSSDVANNPKTRKSMRMMLINQMQQSGYTDKSALKATHARWTQLHEEIQGDIFYNYGTPFKEKAGILSNSVSYQDALDHWVQSVGPTSEGFGEGFDPGSQTVEVNMTDKYITFNVLDENGQRVPGLKNSSVPVRHEVIGSVYNTDVIQAKEKMLETARAMDISEFGTDNIPADPLSMFDRLSRSAEWVGTSANSVLKGLFKKSDEVSTEVKHVLSKFTPKVRIDDVVNSVQHNLDPALVKAVIEIESQGRPGAISKTGNIGLMQLGLSTASEMAGREVTEEELYDPKFNVELGTKYLSILLDKYNDISLALAHYNGGFQAMQPSRDCPGKMKWQCEWDNLEHTKPNTGFKETRDYVPKVLGKLNK